VKLGEPSNPLMTASGHIPAPSGWKPSKYATEGQGGVESLLDLYARVDSDRQVRNSLKYWALPGPAGQSAVSKTMDLQFAEAKEKEGAAGQDFGGWWSSPLKTTAGAGVMGVGPISSGFSTYVDWSGKDYYLQPAEKVQAMTPTQAMLEEAQKAMQQQLKQEMLELNQKMAAAGKAVDAAKLGAKSKK
jgi:hypothetical protein